jgi:hypothetical protein
MAVEQRSSHFSLLSDLQGNQPVRRSHATRRKEIVMSDPTTLPGTDYDPGDAIRPLSVRMTEKARLQLEILADLNGRSVTDETRIALEAWIEKSKTDPKVLERAESVRQKIEREAATRRGAIDSIFEAAPKAGSKPSRVKAVDAE